MKCEPLPDKGMYRLSEDIDIHGIIIEKGFEWDGASIPRLAWTFIGITPFDPKLMRASCVHDYLVGLREALAHRIFYDVMIEDGVEPDLARLLYNAVAVEYKPPENKPGVEYPDGLL